MLKCDRIFHKFFSNRLVVNVFLSVFCIIMLLTNSVTAQAADTGSIISYGDFRISVSQVASNSGAAKIDWSSYNYSDKYFKVYKKAVYSPYNTATVDESYASIGVDYKQVSSVNVLQIYPNGTSANNQIKAWVENQWGANAGYRNADEYQYSANIIHVDSIDNASFNANPNAYLYKRADGSWSYDVVFYGTWDCNNCNDFNSASYNTLSAFVKAGKGLIMGHDVATPSCNANTVTFVRNHFSECMGIYPSGGYAPQPGNTQIELTRTGLFTTYPYKIGSVGTVLTIPFCHTSQQYFTNDKYRWVKFVGQSEDYNVNHYMVTQGNFAMIQTGHSSGSSSTHEQLIIANLCFYCNQMLFASSSSTDYSATDYARPVVQNGAYNYTTSGGTCSWSAYDNGTTYDYYVESFGKDDTTKSGVMATSDVVRQSITVGLSHYQVVLDTNSSNYAMGASTGIRVNNAGSTGSYAISGTSSSSYRYLHVAAVDLNGNVSTPIVITIPPINLVVFDKNTPTDVCMTWNVTGSMANQDFLVGSAKTLISNAYTLADWTFTGWNTKSDGTGTAYTNGQNISFGVSGSTRLYAQWVPNNHTVTYDKNSNYVTQSAGLSANIKHTHANTGYHRVDVNTTNHWCYRPGWTFMGWGSGQSATTTYTASNSPILQTSNMTVYAIYKRDHKLVFASDSISGQGQYSFDRTIYNYDFMFNFASADVTSASTRANVPYTVTFSHNGDDTFTSMGRTNMTTYDLFGDRIITERSLNGWYTAASGGTNVGTSGTDVRVSVYEGANVATKYNVMGNKGNTDVISTNDTTTLYAQWNKAYIILPNAERNLYKNDINGTTEDLFLGWFSNPQPMNGGSGNGGIYYGKPGDTVEITKDTVMYPWYNVAPVEIESYLSSGFWEGQPITYNQLLGLIDVSDKDDRSGNAVNNNIYYGGLTQWKDLYNMNVDSYLKSEYPGMSAAQRSTIVNTINFNDFKPIISSITYYCDGVDDMGKPYSDSVIRTQDKASVASNGLLTDAQYVGRIKICFEISDNGTNINNSYWANSAITVSYDLICDINYNIIPTITTNMVDLYATDPSITSDNIVDILLAEQTIYDSEDDVTYAPWWYTDAQGLNVATSYTRQQLIDSLEIVTIKNIEFQSGFENEHSTVCNRVKAIADIKELFVLKNGSNSDVEAFSHISQFDVVIDGEDQWGKKVSLADGNGSNRAADDNNRRTFKVIVFNNFDDNDLSVSAISERLRYINSSSIDTVFSNSYWGDDFYGKESLTKTFQKYSDLKTAGSSPLSTYSAKIQNEVPDNADRTVNIKVNDYAESTASTYSAPAATYPVYDGNYHELISPGSTLDGTMEYSLDGVTFSTDLPKAVEAGNYTVYYRITGGSNNKSGSIKAVLQKADCVMTKSPTAKELVYTGQPQELMTAGLSSNGTVVYKLGNGEYGNMLPTGVNVGSYVVYYKVSGDNNHKDSSVFTATVTILKADGEVTAPAGINGLVYNGTAQELVTRGGSSTGTVQYRLDNGPWSNNIPTAINDGVYTVSYRVVGDLNHFDVDAKDITVVISKLAGNITAPTVKSNLVYDGTSQSLVNAGYSTTGIVQYNVNGGAWSPLLPSAINAGTYKVGYRVIGDANHDDVEAAYFDCTISKANGSATVPTVSRLVYTGQSQNLIAAITTNTGTVQYSLDGTVWSSSIPMAKNAGLYTVYYKVIGNSNYYDMDVKSVQVELAKADGVLKKPTVNKLTYTGEYQQLISIDSGSTGVVMYKLDNGEWSSIIPTAIDAGSYTVYYKLEADDNHTSVDEDAEAKLNIVIDKAKGRVVAPQARGLAYTGEAQVLIDAGWSDTGVIMYKMGASAYSEDLPVAYTSGTYDVYYKVVADSNHYDVAEQKFTATIGQLAGSITPPTAKTLTYNGQEQELVGDAYSETGIVHYRLGEYGEWSTDIPTAKSAGTYKIYYYSSAFQGGSYSDTKVAYVTSKISKKAGSITVPTAKTDLVYTGKAQALVNAGSTNTGTLYYSVNGGSWSTTVPTATASGTYTISYYVKGSADYDDVDSQTFDVTIAKAFGSITNKPTVKSGLKYTGLAQELINAGSSATGTIQYRIKGDYTWTSKIPTGTEVGTYTVQYYSKGDANHTDTDVNDLTVEINKGSQNFTLTSTNYETIGLESLSGDVVIPETYDDGKVVYTVTAIGNNAFNGNDKLVSVVIPSTVTSLGDSAFANCSNLELVKMSIATTTIGVNCFQNDILLKTIAIPASISSIGKNAFSGCLELKSVVFGDSTGWTRGTTSIKSSDLDDAEIAAKYLTETYVTRTWSHK